MLFGILGDNEESALRAFKKAKAKEIASAEQSTSEQLEAEKNVYGRTLTAQERADFRRHRERVQAKRKERISKIKTAGVKTVRAVQKVGFELQPIDITNFGSSDSILDVTKPRRRKKSILEI